MAHTVAGPDTSTPGRGARRPRPRSSCWCSGGNRCRTVDVQVQPWRHRDRLAVLAAVAAPLIVTAVLVPLRTSFANTDAALVLVAVVVAVAANGNRLAGVLAAVSAAV